MFFCEKTAIRIAGATIHYLDNTLDLMLKAFSNAVQKVCQASIVRFFLNTATSLVDVAEIFQICFHKLYILFHKVSSFFTVLTVKFTLYVCVNPVLYSLVVSVA